MEMSFLWRGMAVGLSIAAPIGPLGILCIRRTLASGMRYGVVTGLAVASADAVYGAVAGFGLGAVSGLLLSHQTAIAVAGGAFLAYLGVRLCLSSPGEEPQTVGDAGLAACFTSAFLLTVASPVTLLYFAAAFARFDPSTAIGPASAVGLVAGVFLGSALWWLFLSGAVRCFRRGMTVRRLLWVNRVSGLCLIAFALVTIASLRG
jgi:threonine/homoserine/homoserine lactone efflux protein